MSISEKRATVISFIKSDFGVLFVLYCRQGWDNTGANRIGAVLTPLSQYPERELFSLSLNNAQCDAR